MIFVTVGTQLPFPRMIAAVVDWARARGRTDLFIQHAGDDSDLAGIPNAGFIDAETAARLLAESDLVMGHAGMGTILSCLELGKPCIIMPRLASLGEHRNEHQSATARRFEKRGGITVAWKESDIADLLDRAGSLTSGGGISPFAAPELVAAVRDFVWQGRTPRAIR